MATNSSGKQLTARMSGIELPYVCAQSDATDTGLISTGFVSAVDDHYVPIHPSTIGPRCLLIAFLYNQWRLNRLTVKYRPFNYQGNYTQIAANGTPGAFPTLAALSTFSSDMAAGFTWDPSIGALSFPEVVEAGGSLFNPSRPMTWTTTSSRWMYVNPRAGDVASDVRWVSPCSFNAVSRANSGSSAALMFGEFEFLWDISFRYPADSEHETLAMKAKSVKPLQVISQSITNFHNKQSQNKQMESKLNDDEKNSPIVVESHDFDLSAHLMDIQKNMRQAYIAERDFGKPESKPSGHNKK